MIKFIVKKSFSIKLIICLLFSILIYLSFRTHLIYEDNLKILISLGGIDCQILDLRSFDMQFCDGRKLVDYNLDTQKVFQMINEADGFIIGMPVYCYSVSGPLKNFIDITSSIELIVDKLLPAWV